MRPVTWTLSLVLVMRGIRSASELHRRLLEVMGDDTPSVEQVRRLASGTPERLTLRTLAGLCAVLEVEPGDLLALGGPVEYDEAWSLHPDAASASKLLAAIKRGSASPPRRTGPSGDEDDDSESERGMTLFDTEQDLASAIGLPLSDGDCHSEFAVEATWSGLASGCGRAGGVLGNGGWRVTYVAAASSGHEGYLIAREQDAALTFTGRSVLLRSGWPAELDRAELERGLTEGWWDPNAAASGDLHVLHQHLEHGRIEPQEEIDPAVAAAVEEANATIARGQTRPHHGPDARPRYRSPGPRGRGAGR